MKVCVIQPAYSFAYEDAEKCFECTTTLMEQCDDSMDVIVLPEYCDVPTVVHNAAEFEDSVSRFNKRIIDKAMETAIRCRAIVFVNAIHQTEKGKRNTTFAINRQGRVVGRYYKAHPAPIEFETVAEGGRGMDASYCYEVSEPYVVEIEGVQYAFLTCYDFYFYESFAAMARMQVDVIIGCSHQRSDRHSILETSASYLCYQTNAYLFRSSVSLGADSEVGGCSLIAAPDGKVLGNLKNDVGMLIREIDVRQKYYKPAGFGRPLAAHYEYIEEGRHPQNYRPGGSAICVHDARLPYPRICAHRGLGTVAPENSMPALACAIALGAQEIEFDLWWTKDGEIVSCHDSTLDRISTGTGNVYDYTLQELKQLDFGVKYGENFKGLSIVTFEEILKKFSCHTIMNIHIKTCDNVSAYEAGLFQKIVSLIRRYDSVKHVYLTSGNDTLLYQAKKLAPEIALCCGGGNDPWGIVERAIAIGCQKVQLYKPYFNQEMIDKAHEHGIICNVFWSDDPQEARQFLNMGIDTILTNEYLKVSQIFP